MNNKEFITELAQQTGYTQSVTQSLVRNIIDEMAVRFDEGDTISIPGFGPFEGEGCLAAVKAPVHPRAFQNPGGVIPPHNSAC